MSNLPGTPFDPKAREAMRKILEIAREADLFVYAIVASREHGEVRFRFPTWSVAQYEEKVMPNGFIAPGFRFKAKTGIQDPTDVAHTRNLISGFYMETAKTALTVGPIVEAIDKKFGDTTETGPSIPAPPWDYR